ncbi:MAG: HD domain-containing protein [Thermoplasmata archaeon]
MAREPDSLRRKSIYDPVHGTMVLEGAALELIGHPLFQRLWGIRQTGFAHLVFPGANHTRLEHSLGVSWVAGRMAGALGIDGDEWSAVVCGGLLHDLGHAPFSHTLDGSMEEVLGHGHERVSRDRILGLASGGDESEGAEGRSVPEILEQHDIDPAGVADLVDPPARARDSAMARSILHGPVDADRIDYLQRDAHYTGVAHGAIDATRLLETLESDRGRPVFAEKGRSALEGFLLGRTLMYRTVYYHKTVRAAEVMLAGGVERLPGYPESARPLFARTDGELLVHMDRAEGFPRDAARALRARRLYKRVGGLRAGPLGRRREIQRQLQRPADRRALESELAQALGGRDGELLLDTSGLQPRPPELGDLRAIVVREDDALTRPFDESPHWRNLLLRPPSRWALAAYAPLALRARATGRIDRLLARRL